MIKLTTIIAASMAGCAKNLNLTNGNAVNSNGVSVQ